jgi:hypothetical protein
MGEDKPELTDPSAQAAESAINTGSADEAAIAERVAEAMRIKTDSTSAQETAVASKTDGGSKSDVSQTKVSSPGANPEEDALKLIEASTGRKFADANEARKYLSNLNSLVGDQAVAKDREAAKLYSQVVERFAGESGKSVDEVKRFFAEELVKSAQQKPESKVDAKDSKEFQRVDGEVEKLRDQLQRMELLSKYPAATKVQEDVAILARQKGISQLEAFEASPLKEYTETKAREESAKSPVVTSSNKVGPDPSKVKEKIANVVRRGSEEDMMALVKEFGDRVGL